MGQVLWHEMAGCIVSVEEKAARRALSHSFDQGRPMTGYIERGQLTAGFLKWTTFATARSGRSAGAYRSLQMAIRGRMRGFEPPPFLFWRLLEGSASALPGLSFSASSLLLLLPALSSLSRALMALRPSAPPERRFMCQPQVLVAGVQHG